MSTSRKHWPLVLVLLIGIPVVFLIWMSNSESPENNDADSRPATTIDTSSKTPKSVDTDRSPNSLEPDDLEAFEETSRACSDSPGDNETFAAEGFEKIDWFNTVAILDSSPDPENRIAAALLTQIAANEQAREILMESPGPEHRIADSVLIQVSGAEQLEADRYKAALSSNPDDPLTLNLIYASCGLQLTVDWCIEQKVEERLIEADGHNGATWGMIANLRTAHGDMEGALSALQRAATASHTHTYFPEHVALLERGLAAGGSGSYSTRAVAAIGAAFVVTHPAGDLFLACENLSQTDHRWHTQCLEFGRTIERQAVGKVDRDFGTLLQRNVLTVVGDQPGLAELREREAQRAQLGTDLGAADFETAFWSNDALVGEFVNALTNLDEFAALELYDKQHEAWLAERCESPAMDSES